MRLSSQAQTKSVGKRIKDQFLRLHHFLFEEEKAALLALRKEEDARLQAVKEKATVTAERIDSFSETIRSLQQEVMANDLIVLQVSAWSLHIWFGLPDIHGLVPSVYNCQGLKANRANYVLNVKMPYCGVADIENGK